jgi:dTDP-4-dehydrorhamnose reductase/dTDP-4-dehydrorhamnose 3,5-epimerase
MVANPTVESTPIPGMVVVHMPVHGDARGWFKENWQRSKMVAAGLPDFKPVQNNISFNATAGVTRGFHAEPWDKYVSVGSGAVFGAWVDLREGPSFGVTYSHRITPDIAVFVPRGVANAFQTLEPETVYTYLVSAHWRADLRYSAVSLNDPVVSMAWPIPLAEAVISDKDLANPLLKDVAPFAPKPIVVTGAGGQFGQELVSATPGLETYSRSQLDITSAESVAQLDGSTVGAIINAAAYTAVDSAETPEGRVAAWAINAQGPGNLADFCNEFDIPLVHVSSDYVFDGSKSSAYTEQDAFAPLGVYGQSKAAGDVAAARSRRHYILRSSWVIGEGANFVRTMHSLSLKGIAPKVVSDQFGRLTFTSEMRRATEFLLDAAAPYGTYNLSNSGDVVSWADIAKEVYRLSGSDPEAVTPITTAEYFADKTGIARRPVNSALDLAKITAAGYAPRDWRPLLAEYVETLGK